MKNKITFTIISITLFSFALTGCGEENKKTEDTFRTVTYFDNNKEVRNLRINECNKLNTMTKIIEKDCSNAKSSLLKDTKSKSVDWTKAPIEWK